MPKSVLLSEISDQPKTIEKLLSAESHHVEKICKELKGRFDYILIAARGTSDNAARYAQYVFGIQNRIQVALATPSLYTIYKTPPNLKGALVIGISQSGESPDIVSVIKEAHRQNCPTLGITNFKNSPLAKASDLTFLLVAGHEKAIAATKTYTSSLCALALLSASFKKNLDSLRQLNNMPGFLQKTIELQSPVLSEIQRYRYAQQFTVVGRGYNYSTAFEIALKIKELNQIITEPYSSADFRHGPIAMIHPGTPIIVIAPKDQMSSDIFSLIHQLEKKSAEIIVISDEKTILNKSKLGLLIPEGIPEWLTPLATVIPGQLFARQLALEKGLDPDNPVGITKVTYTY
jgi:glucosamine--fructose-6-phosphate aminotransferase (isomerizing)